MRPTHGRSPKVTMMRLLRPTTLIAALAISACSGAAVPTSSPSPSPEPSRTPQPSAPAPSATGPAASATTAPAPAGRLVYGRFDSRGVTPFTSNTDGTDERQLVPPHAEQPAWAPNGLLLSVVVESPQGLVFVGTVKADGSDSVRFDSPDPTLNLGCAIWSPDASRLACEGWDETDPTRSGIYTVSSTDGGGLTRITTSPTDRHDLPGHYSLDGSQIFFTRSNPAPLANQGDDSHLMVVNLDGSDEHRLTDQLVGGGSLSPDGTTIMGASGSSLVLVPVGGGQPTPIRIAEAPNDLAFGGSWSPDGQWIVFTLHLRSTAHSDIYIMRRDGTDLRQVTHTPDQDEEFAGWGMTSPPA